MAPSLSQMTEMVALEVVEKEEALAADTSSIEAGLVGVVDDPRPTQVAFPGICLKPNSSLGEERIEHTIEQRLVGAEEIWYAREKPWP
jgi:hypothetical protein